ncbi:unnamed protein product [Urochloa decumbens]|uniref:Uncharacterized protein n=1 Tax=Urochloa decumbens TaxID=240449 RepID=A0ABC9B8C7_9POAL
MDARNSRSILIDAVPGRAVRTNDASAMQEILAIDEKMAKTTQKLEADFSKLEAKIHRFPRGLRGIGGDGGRYIAPSVVAIGPYHHGAPELEKMEEVKLAAAYYLCRNSGHSTVEVYDRVRSVAAAARGCYEADDPSVEGLSDAEFAAMMFLDGCFLLQYMADDAAPVLQNRMTLSTGPSIQKDIFLLENQIPWLVLQALIEFFPVDVLGFVKAMGVEFLPGKAAAEQGSRRRMQWRRLHIPAPGTTRVDESRGGGGTADETYYSPPHLLGLLRYAKVGCMPAGEWDYTGIPSLLSSSAVELAQIGVVLSPSTEAWFGDMRVHRRRRLFGELSLSQLFLSEVTASWLVNMAALEASTSREDSSDGFVVSSYLSVLAMLMDSDEDVAKHVLYSTFSNKQALGFFKGLSQHLRFGSRYFAVLEQIDSYKRQKSVRIAIHRLLYNSFKAMTIATLFSIVGVLVGIFKTLLDNKKQ